MSGSSISKLAAARDIRGLLSVFADPRRSSKAGEALVACAGLGPEAIPEVITSLLDPQLGNAASAVLVQIGDPAKPYILDLAACEDETSQIAALRALYAYARFRGGVGFVDIRRLRDESPHEAVRTQAGFMSEDLDSRVWERIQRAGALVNELSATDDVRRAWRVSRELATADEASKPIVIDTLIKRAEENPWLALALTMVGGPAVQPVIEAMESGQKGLTWTLVMLGQTHPEALDAVKWAAVAHANGEVKAEACRSLELQQQPDRLPPPTSPSSLASWVARGHFGFASRGQ